MREITRAVSEAIEKLRVQSIEMRLSVSKLRRRMERIDPETTTRTRVESMQHDGLLLADMAVAALDALALLSDQVSVTNEDISSQVEQLQESSRKAVEQAEREHAARVAALDLSQRYCELVAKLEAKIEEQNRGNDAASGVT
jgi:hypothetical protein